MFNAPNTIKPTPTTAERINPIDPAIPMAANPPDAIIATTLTTTVNAPSIMPPTIPSQFVSLLAFRIAVM